MGEKAIVAYYRVSTAKQGRSGLGLDAQRAAVQAHASSRRAEVLAEYTDIESGARGDRPQLLRAIAHCRMSGARLVIAKLDRLSRDPDFIGQLMKSEVCFTATDLPDASELTVRIMAAVAEAERRAISDRTRRALAAARARGKRLGNPRNLTNHRWGSEKGNAAKRRKADAYAAQLASWLSDARAAGARSLRAVAMYLNERQVKAPRGGRWSAIQVGRALARVDALEDSGPPGPLRAALDPALPKPLASAETG